MSNLVDEIKEKLPIVEAVSAVVGRDNLQRKGRNWVCCCPFHSENTGSFTVNEERGSFHCFGCGVGGDVFSFVGLHKFNNANCRGEQFVELLQECCRRAGIDWEAHQAARDPQATERMRERRWRVETMTAYANLAKSLWTPEFYVRAKQIGAKPHENYAGKFWLTEDVIERWGLGVAPTVKQCLDAELDQKSLRMLGLLKDANVGREDERSYMHFYDSMIIPHWENGMAVYLSDRAFNKREKKMLNMLSPKPDDARGVPLPWGFNFEALYDPRARDHKVGVGLVEARLDAIACTERGHPALAYLTTPGDGFCAKLKNFPDIKKFYMPDGTPDMTAHKRCQAAARIGYHALCCALPAGTDPDDLPAEELARVKGEARPVLEEWLELVEATPE